MSLSVLELLEEKGFSVQDISSQLGVSRRLVYYSFETLPDSHLRGSRRVRVLASFIIGRHPSFLFPYLPERTRLIDDFDFMNLLQEQKSASKEHKSSFKKHLTH